MRVSLKSRCLSCGSQHNVSLSAPQEVATWCSVCCRPKVARRLNPSFKSPVVLVEMSITELLGTPPQWLRAVLHQVATQPRPKTFRQWDEVDPAPDIDRSVDTSRLAGSRLKAPF